MDKYIGRLLDNRYEILEVIGTGGMAVVYKARCHRLNRLVAIKILKDDFLEDEDFRSRFHAEGQAVAMLSHPNIVSVYDVSTTDAADYIVMELIEGITLKQYMEKKGVLNWKETLHFAIQIAKALEHAHSRGIVHRDIKPHNVMVLKNGSVKVADFGIARIMSKGNTLTKEALGSVHYISPEQAKGGRVDNRSDLYSLGVVMYEMMSGRPPYDGDSPVSVAIKHINGGAVMPSLLNPNIPGGLEQIIMKAMAHEPADRYETAAQMLADMDEFRKDPAILFDYNTPPLDEVTKLNRPPLVLNPSAAKPGVAHTETHVPQRRAHVQTSTSVAQKKPTPKPSGQPSRRPSKEEEQRSNITTIAILACSAVAVIAIIIFLVVLLGGGLTQGDVTYVKVPSLVGSSYEGLGKYPGIQVQLLDKTYHESDAGLIVDQQPASGEEVAEGRTVYVTVSLGPMPAVIVMENLAEMTEARARELLNSYDLNLTIKTASVSSDTISEGCVVKTEPAVDTVLEQGQEVTLWISSGVQVVTKKMPNLLTMNVEEAVKLLEDLGFKVETKTVESNEEKDTVVKQSEKANTMVDVTKLITLEISEGPADTTVPDQQPTEPVIPPNAKDITIDLKGYADTAEAKVKVTRGTDVICDYTVPAGTWKIVLKNQGGYGKAEYKITINNKHTWTEEVVFPDE